jgi:hypothetical protein
VYTVGTQSYGQPNMFENGADPFQAEVSIAYSSSRFASASGRNRSTSLGQFAEACFFFGVGEAVGVGAGFDDVAAEGEPINYRGA